MFTVNVEACYLLQFIKIYSNTRIQLHKVKTYQLQNYMRQKKRKFT